MTETIDALRILHSEFLTYEEGATLLRCEHERLRKAPHDQLPRYKVGKEYQVYRPELIKYVLTYCRVEPRGAIEKILAEVEGVVLSAFDDGPRPSRRSAS